MPYQWNLDLETLFAERQAQMVNRGLPVGDVESLRSRVTDMWTDGPGGWVFEWSQLAQRYLSEGDTALGLLAYGYAKFPTLADGHRRQAYREQIELCVEIAETEPLTFERRDVDVELGAETVSVTVHQYSPPDADPKRRPVLVASGGVDMWKDDLHSVWGACATWTGMTVLAFDIPGTGEATVPMSAESAGIVSGLIREARSIGNGRVAHLGISMGGHFAARTGLAGEVDAAVIFGAPIEAAFTQGFETASTKAMTGIFGSALGFDSPPTTAELQARWETLSLGELLKSPPNSVPMLIVNGADDPIVPQHDTLVFQNRPGSEVHLIPDSGHCAAEKLSEVTPMIIGWLAKTMSDSDS